MNRIVSIIMLAVTALVFASCSTTKTLGEQYAGMYEEKPLAIAIMPPINQTTHVEAKEYFYTTMYMPLCEKGYYVFSPYLTMEMFQQEGAYDAEMFIEGDLSTFRKVLNADAVMFTIVKKWNKSAIGGKITVDVEYILRSAKTGQTLYQREGRISLDTSIDGGSGGIGALISIAATAVNTAATDKVVAGRKCNAYVLSNLPAGKYSNMYEKDSGNPAGKPFVKATVK